MGTYAWIKNQARKRREEEARVTEDRDRQRQMEDMQMEVMRSEMESSRQQAAASQAAAKSAAPLAQKYMQMWQGSLESTKGMFNKAMQNVDRGWDAIKTMQDNKVDFTKLSGDLETEWNNIKDKFGGLTDQAITMAGEEMTQRAELGKSLLKDIIDISDEELKSVPFPVILNFASKVIEVNGFTTGEDSKKLGSPTIKKGA